MKLNSNTVEQFLEMLTLNAPERQVTVARPLLELRPLAHGISPPEGALTGFPRTQANAELISTESVLLLFYSVPQNEAHITNSPIKNEKDPPNSWARNNNVGETKVFGKNLHKT